MFDEKWEREIYSKGRQINKYPFGELVSVFFNSLKYLETNEKDKKNIKVLEIGCGAGNNLWFLAEQGFDTYGIDGSHSACKAAKELQKQRNVNVTIQQAYFDNLPFDDNSMDIIIDREATCCGTLNDVKKWWREANRVLKKGGLIISLKYANYDQDLLEIQKGTLNATQIEENTFKDIESGTFMDTGIIHFTTYDELFEIFSFCDIKFINRLDIKTAYDTVGTHSGGSEWIVVGIKK